MQLIDPPVLNCPACHQNWTHLDRVEVLSASGQFATVEACGEDGASFLTIATGKRPVADREVGRRHLVTLVLTCETCPEVTRIEFRQHKGETFTSPDVRLRPAH